MATEPGRVYGGVSAPDRRAAQRRRLLEAGLELFGSRSVADVTIADVCNEAGLAKRYFYEQFETLPGFVDAVIDDVVQRLDSEVLREGSASGTDWPRRRIATFVERITDDPRIARLLLVETFGASGSLGALREAVVHRAVETLVSDFLPAEPVDARRLRMAAFALSGAAAELILAWLQDDVEASADEVVDYLTRLFAQTPSLVRLAVPSVG